MPLHFNGKDKDGTHRISGSSDELSTMPRWSTQTPLSLYIDCDGGKYIGQGQFKVSGDVRYTDLSTFVIYRNGMQLDSTEFRFDYEKGLLTISPIVPTDSYIELRSASTTHQGLIFKDMKLLGVDKYITEDMLKNFIPEFGDNLDVKHMLRYQENQKFSAELAGIVVLRIEILSCHVKPDGLYGDVKMTITQ